MLEALIAGGPGLEKKNRSLPSSLAVSLGRLLFLQGGMAQSLAGRASNFDCLRQQQLQRGAMLRSPSDLPVARRSTSELKPDDPDPKVYMGFTLLVL